MKIGFRRGFILISTIGLSLILLIGVLALADRAGPAVYAASPADGQSASPAVRLSQTYTPVVTITLPVLNAVLTTTHLPTCQVQVDYTCGNGCVGLALLEALSITVDGGLTYHEAVSGIVTGRYIYSWTLPAEDYVTHPLIARARNGWGNVGASAPVTVYVDTAPPQGAALIVPAYTESTTFTVSWSATDGSGVIKYDLQYKRDDQTAWTDWLTSTDATSGVFTVSSQTVEEGHYYTLRMQVRDKGDNSSDWVTGMIRVGRHRLYLPLVVRNHPPSWKQGIGSQGMRFRTPSGCGDRTWYAGTMAQDGVWKSTDSAQTWNKVADLQSAFPVVANPADCEEAFVAAWGSGVHRLVGTNAPEPITGNLGEPWVYGLTLTGTTLYAGTASQGVYKTDLRDINWQSVNTGLPDLRIRSLYTVGANLYAGSRNCTLYVSPDGGSSWGVQTALTIGCDDAQVWSIAPVKDTLYAGLGLEKGLYYLNGLMWKQVTAVPARTIYGLAYDEANGYLNVSAYEAGVYRCPVDADGKITACSTYNAGLTTLNTREIDIHGGLLAVGSDDGIWYRPLVP